MGLYQCAGKTSRKGYSGTGAGKERTNAAGKFTPPYRNARKGRQRGTISFSGNADLENPAVNELLIVYNHKKTNSSRSFKITGDCQKRSSFQDSIMVTDSTNFPEGPGDPVMQNLIRDEILRVRADRDKVLFPKEHKVTQISVIVICLLVNLAFSTYRSDYIALFIAASFYLNMFYFISLLIPTSPGSVGTMKPDISRSLSWLKKMGLIPGTSRFTRLFMNAFFLNSRALTSGLIIIFSIDILYAIAAYNTMGLSFNTIVIVISQAAIIIVFYLLVWKIEPFSTKYAKNVRSVKDKLSREKIPAWIITLVFFMGFMASFVLFMTTIILLPGMTVSMFLSQSGLSEIGYLVALLAALGMSQYFIVRYLHGITSRVLVERLFEYKESSLQQLLKTGTDGPTATGDVSKRHIETTIVLLESRIYQIQKNSFFGLFPVYVVNLDFSVLLDSSAITTITGYIHDGG
jgi:hypothetical protein